VSRDGVGRLEADRPPAKGPPMSASDLRQLYREGHAPFDGPTFEIEVGPVVEGDLVAARWAGKGRYKGGMPGALGPAG
jgi:hypothetical protein